MSFQQIVCIYLEGINFDIDNPSYNKCKIKISLDSTTVKVIK